jgi:MFS family permease
MVPKEHYARSSSMMSMAGMGSGILAPALAGALLALTGLQWILIIDIVTFLVAITTVLLVKIPQPFPSGQTRPEQDSRADKDSRANKTRLGREIGHGFQYVLARPSLLGLLLIFFFGNFFASATFSGPMILSHTQNNTQILGLVSSVASAAGVIGNLVMIAWGGPRRRMYGVIFGWLAGGLLGVSLMGVNGGLPVWLAAGFFGGFIPAIIDASNQALWQAKVPLNIQGRISSLRWLFALGAAPLAMLIAGPLTDRVVEPAMQAATGLLPAVFGRITGTGPGSGMAVMFLVSGLCIVATSLIAWEIPAIRNIESLLPDHSPGGCRGGSGCHDGGQPRV